MSTGRPEAKGFLKLDPAAWKEGLDTAEKHSERFHSSVESIFKRVAIAVGAVGTASVLVGVNFEQAMADVKAVANATETEFADLGAAARRMGAETSFSAREAAAAEQELLKAGLDVTETIASLEGVMMLAGAAGSELAFSAEVITATMKAWNIEATETNRVVNALYQSTVISRLGMDSLNAAIGAGAAASALWGVELEESLAIFGALTDVLGDGSAAGTYIKNVLSELNDVIAKQKGVLGEVLQGWNPATEGIIGAIERLEAAGVTADVALQELGDRAGPGLALLIQRGSAALKEMRDEIGSGEAAFKAYETRMATTKGRFAELTSAAEEAAVRIFGALQNPLDDALLRVTQAIQANYATIEKAAEDLAAVIGTLITAFSNVAEVVQEDSGFFTVLAGTIGGATVAMYGYISALKIAATVQAAFNALLVANPIGLIVVAIGALIGAQIALIEKTIGLQRVWDFVQEQWRNLILTWNLAIEKIKHVGDAISRVWETIQQPRSAREIWRGFEEGHQEALDKIVADWRKHNADIVADYNETMAKVLAATIIPIGPEIGVANRAAAGAGTGTATGGSGERLKGGELRDELLAAEKHAAALTSIRVRHEDAAFVHKMDLMALVEQRQVDHYDLLGRMSGEYHERTVAIDGQRLVDHFDFSARLHEEYAAKARVFHEGMWASISNAMSAAISVQAVMHMKLGKIAVQAAKEGAAGMIEAQGKKWAYDAAGYGYQALAFAAIGDFRGAAQMAAASIGLFALAGTSAGVAGALRHVSPSGGGRTESFEESESSEGRSFGGRSTVDLTNRSSPETVNVYQTTIVHGSVFGDTGIDELTDRYVIPRLRALYEGGALWATS